MRAIVVATVCCTAVALVRADSKTCEVSRVEVAKLRDGNERAFTKALAAKQLAPLKSTLTFEPEDAKLRKPGSVFTVRDKGKAVRLVALEQYADCKPRDYELVTDRAKRVWTIRRAPHPIGNRAVTLCGCRPYNEGCGANPGLAQMLLELPADTTYGGEVTIMFDATTVLENYTNTLPDGSPCPREQYAP